MYQKEIIYMGLYKDGSRMGSAGFLKVENKERESKLYLKIQNIPLGINGRFPIRVYDGSSWKELSGVAVQGGVGSWEENLTGNVNRTVIQVMMPGGYVIEGRSKYASGTMAQKDTDASSKPQNITQPDTIRAAQNISQADTAHEVQSVPLANTVHEVQSIPLADTAREPQSITQPDMAHEQQNIQQEDTAREAQSIPQEDTIRAAENMPQADTAQEPQEQRPREPVRKPEKVIITEELPRRLPEDDDYIPQSVPDYNLKEDKWEQILSTYENIHPYGDDRVYVKLDPKDFVILQSKYQYLVNNSFLLHGFYNYRYIILGKEQDYYLGVPGVYYEREKMVAQMFGFEAFECPGGNVRAGEFGYYLRKVEL